MQSELNTKKFTGPVTAETSDPDLNTFGGNLAHTFGLPHQVTTHLLRLQRHVLQLEAKNTALEVRSIALEADVLALKSKQ